MSVVADKPQATSPESSAGEIPSFEVTLRIARFDPEGEKGTHWQDFTVTMHGTDPVSYTHLTLPTKA